MSMIQSLSTSQQKAFLDRTVPANKATVKALVQRGLLTGDGDYTENGRWCLFQHQNRRSVIDFQPGDPVVYMDNAGNGGHLAIRPVRSVVVRTTGQYVVVEDWPGRVGSLHKSPRDLAHLADVEEADLPIDGYDPAESFGSSHAVVRGAGLGADGDEMDDFEPYPDPEPRPEPFVYAAGERARIGDKVRFVKGLLPPYTIVSSAIGVVTQVGHPGKPEMDTLTIEWSAAGAEPFTQVSASKLKLVERVETEPEQTRPTEWQAFSARQIFEAHRNALASRAILEAKFITVAGRLFVTSAEDLRWSDENGQGEVRAAGEWFPVTELGIVELSAIERLHWRKDDGTVLRWDAEAAPYAEETGPIEMQPEQPNITELKLSEIRLDGRFQLRAAMRDDVVEEYAEAMRDGAEFPPVLVYWSDDADYGARGKFLIDGFHRYRAAVRAGRETILAEVRPGGLMEALWASLTANATHGLRRSRADLQRAIDTALVHSYGKGLSDREIARHVGCDHKTVGARRRVLVQSGRIATNYLGTPPVSGEVPQLKVERVEHPNGLRSIEEAAALFPYYATYRELVAAYPGRLVLMMHALWYMAWDESVEPIKAVLTYRVGRESTVDQIIRRPSASIPEYGADESLGLLTQANYSLAVMERDGSVRLIEPDGAVSYEEAAGELTAQNTEDETQDVGASFVADGGAPERDSAPENARCAEWRDARVLMDIAGRPRGIVMKYGSQQFRAWRVLEPHKPQHFATHQLAVEWLEERVR